jgi:hypothetical protein
VVRTESDRARAAAAQAADEVRTINQATQQSVDLQVGDAYAITADLASLERRFHQAALQLAAALVTRIKRGDLRHGTGGDIDDAVLTAHDRLTCAGDLAAHAAHLLEQAQNALAAIADHDSLIGAPTSTAPGADH